MKVKKVKSNRLPLTFYSGSLHFRGKEWLTHGTGRNDKSKRRKSRRSVINHAFIPALRLMEAHKIFHGRLWYAHESHYATR